MKDVRELIEERNNILKALKEMSDKCVSEKRGLTEAEDAEVAELRAKEIELKEEIKALKEEIRKGATIIEDEKTEERGNVDMEMNKELEVRGVEQYLRRADGEELRNMNYAGNGGLIPEYLHGEVVKALPEVAPLFAEVPKITPQAGTVRIAVEDNIGDAGFVGEASGITAGDATFKTVELKQVRAGSAIELTQKLINDAGIDVVSYSQALLFRRLGYAIDRAMITGDGNDNIQGLNDVKTKHQDVCKVDGAVSIETILKMASGMETVYQTGAKWVMNRELFQEIFCLVDANGRPFMVREVVGEKVVYKILGLEVLVNDSAKNIFLVNFGHAYAGMIKREATLTTVNSDRASALAGTTTLVLDTYIDAKIVQPKAIRYLEVTPGRAKVTK